MASKQDRVREARERADKAAAALAAFDKAAAEREAAAKTFHARWAAFVKRSRIVMANLAGDFVQKALAEFHGEFNYTNPRPTTPKQIAAALEGGAKIGGNGYGQSYSLSGLAPRLRLLSKAQVRDVTRAKAKMDRAQAALNRATQEWKAAKKAAFEAGEKIGKDALVTALIAREKIRLTTTPLPDGIADLSTWRRDQLVEKVEQAGIHLAATRKGEECPCHADVAERQQAAAAKAEAERIAALPKVTATCSTHGKRRMGSERIRHFLDAKDAEPLGLTPGWQDRLPILRCPGGDALIDQKQVAADVKAAAKAKALAAKAVKAHMRDIAARKAAGAKLPAPSDGDSVAFVCPACDHVVEFAEVMDYGDGDPESEQLVVQCDRCGSESSVSGVARLSLPAQQEGEKAA